MSWLLSDMKTWLRHLDAEDGSTRAEYLYTKMANDANRLLHEAGNWSFDRVKGRLHFEAEKTGTCNLSVDATALTGGSGFAIGDVGKFVRLRGETLQYLIGAYVSASALTLADTYRGPSAVSAGAFSLTQDRLALPARFREMDEALIDLHTNPLPFVTMDEIDRLRMYSREVSFPRMYSVEYYATSSQLDSGTSKAPYLWVYPAPSDKRTVEYRYFEWPAEMDGDSDGISAPAAADKVHREFLRALLLLDQGKADEYDNQLRIADAMAKRSLAQFMVTSCKGQREYWTPEADAGVDLRPVMWPGPNEGP